MNKSRSLFSILIPSMTVFFSSGCIMVLEIVAGRLIARHLGSSLYTWTSVIGVVLAGIAIGNYLGGRIADCFPAKKTLAVLFGLSSIACVGIIVLNNLVGNWVWMHKFTWPMRIFSHVSLVFLVPSTLLGSMSPVIAKMALDRGLPMGRTVGNVYAWGAAGSIAGTFLAGFYLIAMMGTIAIIWTVGAALLLMGILYWVRLWVLYVWAAVFVALITIAMLPTDLVKNTAAHFALKEKFNPCIIYETESQYSYITVQCLFGNPDVRAFIQDRITQSLIKMNDIRDLKCYYTQVYAAVTHQFTRDKKKLSTLFIGGGGYVFPRYIEKVWPGSCIDVVEIDPEVTEAAMQEFGLERDTTINTIIMDARNYVDELLKKQQNGEKIMKYDFIYGDAFNDYSVPYQLITKEFNDKIAQVLENDGVYMINIIDIFDSGLFVGAVINTMQQTFPYVCIVSVDLSRHTLCTFVVIAGNQEINLESLNKEKRLENLGWILSDWDIRGLKEKTRGIVLTDDYAPVQNLLAPAELKAMSKK